MTKKRVVFEHVRAALLELLELEIDDYKEIVPIESFMEYKLYNAMQEYKEDSSW